ncbi:MAG: hypothetical protein NC432_12790, partial [Roseburia sp.]|nr:hypothetical protein [Roseburia sp.]MCM1099570.1 hypothetical protein [Ruminococcus flavefaciens]
NYQDIKRVFSIWVCMNMPENSMSYVHLIKDDMLGSYPCEYGLDLLNIVLIGITNVPPEQDVPCPRQAGQCPEHEARNSEYGEQYEMHRLLSTLLSTELSVKEKLGILESEYRISTDEKIKGDMETMCNLSQGIREKGRLEGRVEGRTEEKERIIHKLHGKGYALEVIADIVEESIAEVTAVIGKGGPVSRLSQNNL